MLPNISFSHEPAVWVGLLTAIIGAVAVFFPHIMSVDQQKALLGLVVVLVPILLSVVVRQNSTPNAKLPTPIPIIPPPAPPAPPAV